MDWWEIMRARHSVRRFLDKPLADDAVKALNDEIELCNREGGLHLQLITDEPEAFAAGKPSYGQFKGCRNYLALVGPKDRDEAIGYYGERVVLCAQSLGVNSCWVALTYRRGRTAAEVAAGEKLYMVIALGYGETQGTPHRGKTRADIADERPDDPDWFRAGLDAVLLAPTAVNQQKFRFTRVGDRVHAKAGVGFYTKTDLGIAKYHFERGAGKDPAVWA